MIFRYKSPGGDVLIFIDNETRHISLSGPMTFGDKLSLLEVEEIGARQNHVVVGPKKITEIRLTEEIVKHLPLFWVKEYVLFEFGKVQGLTFMGYTEGNNINETLRPTP